MLLVGTKRGLLDLDTGQTLIEDAASQHWHLAPADGTHSWTAGSSSAWTTKGSSPSATTRRRRPELGRPGRRLVVGRTGARLAFVGGQVEQVSAFEMVPGRDHWKNPADATPDTRSMAASGDDLWVNIHVGGLWHSVDRGETWQAAIEPQADIHEVRAENGLVAVSAAVGFGWSEDGGKSWSWSTEGLHENYLRAVCFDGETTYVSASEGPFTKRGAVYRARLGSAFVRCGEGLPEWFPGNIDTGHLDAGGGRAVIGFGEQVNVTEDDGESWHTDEVPGVITTVRLGQN